MDLLFIRKVPNRRPGTFKGDATIPTRIVFRFRLPDPSLFPFLVVDHMAIVTLLLLLFYDLADV